MRLIMGNKKKNEDENYFFSRNLNFIGVVDI